jgi:hypothetical protein
MADAFITDPGVLLYCEIIEELHKNWTPHQGQIIVGHALFALGYRRIFIVAGRKWGKTEDILYILNRWGKSHPNIPCLYVAPELKQARNIVWTDPRLKKLHSG